MKLKKRLDKMKDSVTGQLEKVNLEGVLEAVGLQMKKHGKGMAGPILASFGAGLAMGGAAGLLLAPMTGKDLRGKIMALANKIPGWHDTSAPASSAKIDPQPPAAKTSEGSNGRTRHMPEGAAST